MKLQMLCIPVRLTGRIIYSCGMEDTHDYRG